MHGLLASQPCLAAGKLAYLITGVYQRVHLKIKELPQVNAAFWFSSFSTSSGKLSEVFFGHKNNKTLEFFPFGKVLHSDGIDWDVLILKRIIMTVTFSCSDAYQQCPVELSVMTDTFCTFAVSSQVATSHLSTKHLKCGCD